MKRNRANRQIIKKAKNVRVVMQAPGKSAKKKRRDKQKQRLLAKREQDELVESGLVTKEDIEEIERQQAQEDMEQA